MEEWNVVGYQLDVNLWGDYFCNKENMPRQWWNLLRSGAIDSGVCARIALLWKYEELPYAATDRAPEPTKDNDFTYTFYAMELRPTRNPAGAHVCVHLMRLSYSRLPEDDKEARDRCLAVARNCVQIPGFEAEKLDTEDLAFVNDFLHEKAASLLCAVRNRFSSPKYAFLYIVSALPEPLAYLVCLRVFGGKLC